MKLKIIAKSFFVGCGFLLLGACAAPHRNQTVAPCPGACNNETYATGAAQTAGLGEETRFNSMCPEMMAKRTYYFDFDKDQPHPEDHPAIYANATKIAAKPHSKVVLAGHTDPRGSREYNVGLGERRAKTVKQLMEEKGVSGSQVRIVSYGAEKPASTGTSDRDYALDRRVKLAYEDNE